MENIPRRSEAAPGVRRLTGTGRILLTNSDTTWAAELVSRIFVINPLSDAYWKREHPLEPDVEMVTPNELHAEQAAFSLLHDLNELRVSPDGGVDCLNFSVGFANLIRRALMTRISVLAVDSVIIDINGSGVLDEILAHRIGQLAIEGEDESAIGTLQVDGRAARGSDLLFDVDGVRVAACDAEVILAPLHQDCSLLLRSHLRRGRALEHAKFASVRAVPIWRRYVLETEPSLDIRNCLFADGFVIGNDLDLRRIDGNTMRIERVQEVLDKNGFDSLKIKIGDAFCLPIEPLGQMTAEKCLSAAVFSVSEEIKSYMKLLNVS
jgi:hypothetical protein